MLLSLFVLTTVANMPVDPKSGESALTTLQVKISQDTTNLSWNDTEDTLKGSIVGRVFRVGQPMALSVHVASYEGEEFTGPVTISLRPLSDLGGGESHTVERSAGDHLWYATFTPREAGEHRLEVSFRTTHLKTPRGVVVIEDAKLSAWFPVVFASVLIVVAIAAGAWLVSQREGARPEGPAPAEKSDPPS
jgi:hypothetical protein